MTAAVVALGVVVAVLCLLVAGLLRSHAAILRSLHDLGAGVEGGGVGPTPVDFNVQPGIPAPAGDGSFPEGHDVSGATLTEGAVHLRVAGVGHDTLLAFLSSTCLTCGAFWEAFADPAGVSIPNGTRLVIVTKGADEESPAAVAELAPAGFDLVMSSRAWVDYKVPGSPYFVSIEGATGRVRGEGTGMSWEQVAGLLAQATGDLRFTAGDAAARRPKPASDAERELAVDRELMAAGLFPGDPRLYHEGPDGHHEPEPESEPRSGRTDAAEPGAPGLPAPGRADRG